MKAECNYQCGSSRMVAGSLHGSVNNTLSFQMKNIRLLSRAIISTLSQLPPSLPECQCNGIGPMQKLSNNLIIYWKLLQLSPPLHQHCITAYFSSSRAEWQHGTFVRCHPSSQCFSSRLCVCKTVKKKSSKSSLQGEGQTSNTAGNASGFLWLCSALQRFPIPFHYQIKGKWHILTHEPPTITTWLHMCFACRGLVMSYPYCTGPYGGVMVGLNCQDVMRHTYSNTREGEWVTGS